MVMPRRIIAPHRVASGPGAVGRAQGQDGEKGSCARRSVWVSMSRRLRSPCSVNVPLGWSQPRATRRATPSSHSSGVQPRRGRMVAFVPCPRAAMRICACTPSTSTAARARLWLSPRCSRNNVLACQWAGGRARAEHLVGAGSTAFNGRAHQLGAFGQGRIVETVGEQAP